MLTVALCKLDPPSLKVVPLHQPQIPIRQHSRLAGKRTPTHRAQPLFIDMLVQHPTGQLRQMLLLILDAVLREQPPIAGDNHETSPSVTAPLSFGHVAPLTLSSSNTCQTLRFTPCSI